LLTSRQAKYLHEKDLGKKSYFTQQTRDYYYQVFKTHFHTDQKIEIAKKKCVRRPTFNIHDAFATIDIFKQGKLNKEDLKRFL
jgi:hypothetical protein